MADDSLADSENDWRDIPVAVHILTLASGKKIKIEMYYDQKQLFHCDVNDFKHVTNLDDLSTNFEFVEKSDKCFMTNLSMQIGDTDWKMSNRGKNIVRFRFGPQIAQSMGENEVEGYGTLKTLEGCQPEFLTMVRMEVTKDEEPVGTDNYELLRRDFFRFIDTKSSRFLNIESEKLPVPAEILSLHSEYFCTLFYGDFAEKNQETIDKKYLTSGEFSELMKVFVLPKSLFLEKKLKMAILPDTLRLLDQFSCIELFKKVEIIARTMSETLVDESSFQWIIEVADILDDQQILVKYLNRFPLAECLHSLAKKNATVMNQISTPLLTQRMTSVCNEMPGRPRIRFVFTQGEVVCCLFGESQSQPLNHFMNLFRAGSVLRSKQVYRTKVHNDLCLDLSESFLFPIIKPSFLFASCPILLRYACFNNQPALYFLPYRSNTGNRNSVLGVVFTGHDILPSVTKLLSISVVS